MTALNRLAARWRTFHRERGRRASRLTDHATRGLGWTLSYGTMDPNTGLISWPEFSTGFGSRWTAALRSGSSVGLAVGDVDDLKIWLEERNANDPTLFGHVAGNALMAELGKIAGQWFKDHGPDSGCLATFGGDEIILAAVGLSHERFGEHVRGLAARLNGMLPRTVSFAFGSYQCSGRVASHSLAYEFTRAIIEIDKALFGAKTLRRAGSGRAGVVVGLQPRTITE